MGRRDTRLIRSFASSDRGFTLLELLVTTVLGLLLVVLILGTITANRRLYKEDIVRTKVNQNLRGAMDIIGADIRLAGENLGPTFPAIQLVNGAAGGPDTLVLRRNLVPEVLQVCVALSAGSTAALRFAIPGTTAGCIYSGETTAYNSWRSYRLANQNSVDSFVWNVSAKVGEFFRYTGETDSGTGYSITRSGAWSNAYPVAAAAYLLEEWRFAVSGDVLQLVRNQDDENTVNLAFEVQDFQVRVLMQDGTIKTSFTTNDSWTTISSLEVVLSSSDTFQREDLTRTLTSRFFPRNILSN